MADLGEDVDAAHDELIQVAVSEDVWGLHHTVFETGPHPGRREQVCFSIINIADFKTNN